MALIHLDAGVLIGFLDAGDSHHDAARAVVAEGIEQGDRLAMATSAFAECLVGPSRRGGEAVDIVQDLRRRLPIEMVDLDVRIAAAAAELRGRHRSLRLPDALVIASALDRDADVLVTTDRRWPAPEALGARAVIRTI